MDLQKHRRPLQLRPAASMSSPLTSSLQERRKCGIMELRKEAFDMIQILIPGIAVCAAWLLYRQGCMATKCIAAALFSFRAGKNCDRVSTDSCRGWIRHLIKVRECRTYEFTLSCQLSKGTVEVSLLDEDKQELLRLDHDSPSGRVQLDGKSRYYLLWRFHSATGDCGLYWQGR